MRCDQLLTKCLHNLHNIIHAKLSMQRYLPETDICCRAWCPGSDDSDSDVRSGGSNSDGSGDSGDSDSNPDSDGNNSGEEGSGDEDDSDGQEGSDH